MDYLPLGGQLRGFTLRASVSSSITHRCFVFVFASLFLNLCHLLSAMDVILFDLDYVINFVISLCSFSTHILFDIKLELVICKLGV